MVKTVQSWKKKRREKMSLQKYYQLKKKLKKAI